MLCEDSFNGLGERLMLCAVVYTAGRHMSDNEGLQYMYTHERVTVV